MRHDWIIDVLTDLRAYALQNRLPRIAEETEALLRTARAEIVARATSDDEGGVGGGHGGTPPRGLPH